MKFSFVLLCSLLSAIGLHAESNPVISDDQQILKYLNQSSFSIDTTAKAVVLYEKGSSFVYDGYLEHKVERVVKILGKDAIPSFATVNISKGAYSTVGKIKAITYNLENGVISKQEIERADILKDEIDKDISVSKFNLPSVREGSVIYYTYTINTPSWIYVPDWTFQNKYPTLTSVYQINIPAYITYNALERINVNLKQASKERDLLTCQDCSFQQTLGNQTNHTWIRNNIPGFKEEPYMSSEENYKERIKIHITAFRGAVYNYNVYNNWSQVCKKRYYDNEEYCGQVFAGNAFLSEKVAELTKGKDTELDKAKAIFAYVRGNMRAKTSLSGNRASGIIKDIFAKQEGSASGVNLLLIAMLRKAGLQSEPVLLGTRSNEKLNDFYPDLDNINYLVGRVKISSREYFLDASVKQMPFGYLAPDCYNGYCRVINEKGGYTYLDADSLRNKTTVIVTLSPAGDNKLQLKVDEQLGLISGIKYREEWKDDTSAVLKMIKKELSKNTYTTTLDKYSLSNMNDPDLPLTIHYEASVDFKNDAETIYFDPYFFKFFDKNPYSAVATRRYPIEMDYIQDINYIFRLQLPAGYQIDDYPKSSVLKFTDKDLISVKNSMTYEQDNNTFSLSSKFSARTTFFNADFYNELRSFYERIMEEQNKKIVIKKNRS